ncbi:glutathione peroxidase [Dyadobacter sp. CY312]|uniref:glutathione peroxidase n=1 Tax=Dyadobacter sp. CY312 TaxID=2907303 RepID=UPI001F168D81|nr:glutathione peroxidase [Dyadobacter sp. CY312]
MITSLITGIFADKSEIVKRPAEVPVAKQSLYDFKVKSLVGDKVVDLSQYKGKKVVILNVASKCGYTKQYADWEKFNKDHGDKVVVLGFPSNNFGGQEPGTSEEIATFCSATYGVTFPMFEKVEVKGENKAPLYKWLSTKDLNGWNDKEPSWNFCKYVVNENGELTQFFASKILPTDPEFLKAVGI